jgi:uncharacterized protein GlcG (DUF336 family)
VLRVGGVGAGPDRGASPRGGPRQRSGRRGGLRLRKNSYAVTAIVVDIDGVRQAVLRGDGAPVHTLDSAYAKAYTAASLAPVRKEDSTKAIFERLSKNPSTTASLGNLPNVTFTPGGVTIMAAGKPIGGIGVGGAPGGNFDDDCARAALDKIKDRMK